MKKTILPTTAVTVLEGQDPPKDLPEGVKVQVVKRKVAAEAGKNNAAPVGEEVKTSEEEDAEEENVSSVVPAKKAPVKKSTK